MRIHHFLQERRSTRDFKNKPIQPELEQDLLYRLEALQKQVEASNVKFHYRNDGENIYKQFNGLGGYAGVMIEAPAYIAIETPEDDAKALVTAAYTIEKLLSQLESKELGTCWITMGEGADDLLKEIFNLNGNKIHYMIGLGYPKKLPALGETQYSSRIALEDYVFMKNFSNPATVEELEQRGLSDLFYYVKFAPSAKNRQPWRFVIHDDNIELYIEDYQGRVNLVDAGIIMYYFYELMEEQSNPVEWIIDPKPAGEYLYIGMVLI